MAAEAAAVGASVASSVFGRSWTHLEQRAGGAAFVRAAHAPCRDHRIAQTLRAVSSVSGRAGQETRRANETPTPRSQRGVASLRGVRIAALRVLRACFLGSTRWRAAPAACWCVSVAAASSPYLAPARVCAQPRAVPAGRRVAHVETAQLRVRRGTRNGRRRVGGLASRCGGRRWGQAPACPCLARARAARRLKRARRPVAAALRRLHTGASS